MPACGGSVVQSYTYDFGFLALTSPMLRESQFYEPCKNWGMRGAVFQFILRPNPPILFVRARKIVQDQEAMFGLLIWSTNLHWTAGRGRTLTRAR
jgi:hypothetical protein